MSLKKWWKKLWNSAEETTSLTLDDPTGWPTGTRLFGGRELQAMRLPAVNACIEMISDSMAKMPVFITDGATREKLPNHPVARLLNERPTETLTAFDYHKLMETWRITQGNAYALIFRDKWGSPKEVLPIRPGFMTPYVHTDGTLWYVGTNPKTQEYRKFYPSEILHYKAFTVNGIEGISYLRRGADIIEAGLLAQKYESSFYANSGRPDGVLQTQTDLSHVSRVDKNGEKVNVRDKIRAEWERIHSGADNAYRIAILDNGLEYRPLSFSNRDAQFIESKEASIEDIGRLFNIPLYKLGVGKQTYASNVQAAIEYMQRTLAPIVSAREQEDSYKLLSTSERQKGLRVRRNMMNELRGDWAARAVWFRTMHDAGVYSVNDIRALEDMPDVPGGDERLASLNYVPLELFRELSVSRNGEGGTR